MSLRRAKSFPLLAVFNPSSRNARKTSSVARLQSKAEPVCRHLAYHRKNRCNITESFQTVIPFEKVSRCATYSLAICKARSETSSENVPCLNRDQSITNNRPPSSEARNRQISPVVSTIC